MQPLPAVLPHSWPPHAWDGASLRFFSALLAGQWGAVGLVLTAKSVARFKRMDDQAFAEIYLVGTMTSVLIAALCGLVLRMAFGPLA